MKGTRKRIIFTVTGFIRNKEIRRKFIDKEIKRFSKWKNAIKLRCIWWADIIEKLMEVEETKLSEVRNDSMHGRERNKDFCRKNMIKYLQTTIRNIKSNWFLWLLWKEEILGVDINLSCKFFICHRWDEGSEGKG